MDEGPFRMPRQANNNAHEEPVPVDKPAEQPTKAHEEPKPVHRTSTSHRTFNENKPSKKLFVIIAAVILSIILIGVVIFTIVSGGSKSGLAIDSNKFQAVFFTNGQVYFGKLQQLNDEYMRLKEVYYLQTQADEQQADSKNPQQTNNDQEGTKLIKLGDEIHGPEDEMIISKDQILFYENLKTDGTVSKSIEKFKNPN